MKNKDKKSIAYKVGYGFGITCILCLATVIIASTVKFLMWLF